MQALRIATWNLNHAIPSRRPAFAAFMDLYAADVWVLTETQDSLAPALGMIGVHSDPRPKDAPQVKPTSRYSSIWTNMKIVERVDCADADRSRTVAVRLDLGQGMRLLVYGTVLPWASDGRFPGAAKAQELERQIGEWRKLRGRYPEDLFCLAGDFNADMAQGRVGSQTRIALLNAAFQELDLVCVTAPDPTTIKDHYELPVDHIALSRVAAKTTSVIARWPADKAKLSDHGGVVVEVR